MSTSAVHTIRETVTIIPEVSVDVCRVSRRTILHLCQACWRGCVQACSALRSRDSTMSRHTPAPARNTPAEHLAGTVERVTFYSEETGFCLLWVKVRSHHDPVTYVGKVPVQQWKTVHVAS